MIYQAKIWFLLGFITKVFCDTIFPLLWDDAWYHLTAFSFVCYLRVIYLMSHGVLSVIVFIAWLTSINALLDELFFDPSAIELNEYIGFIIMILIVFKYKCKWMR
jgi:hypothetical protein